MLRPRQWDSGPTTDTLGELAIDDEHDANAVLGFVADSYGKAFQANGKELDRKATALTVALYAVFAQAGGLIFVGVLVFWSVDLHPSSVGECSAPMG